MATAFDVIIVGSGINGLVCAALAAKRGLAVCVLERADEFGGCIRSAALTQAGYLHDTLSGFHPLFVASPGYAALRADLESAGLRYCNCDKPTGVVLPDGAHALLTTSRERNAASFDSLCAGDGAAFLTQMRAFEDSSRLTFGLLGNELWSASTLRLLLAEGWRRGPGRIREYAGETLQTSRQWLDSNFRGNAFKALLAPWALHAGLGPDDAMSGFMLRLIAFTLEGVGMPIVAGGSAGLVAAFARVIERNRGVLMANADVERILVNKGRARGVRVRDGRTFTADRAVVCSVTPTQLYSSLLTPDLVPERIRRFAGAYKYGLADMQIHLALSEAPRWKQPALGDVAMVHVSAGMDSIAQALGEARMGMLPAHPTIVVGQPSTMDPTRAPRGGSVLWIQLQELPARIRGDGAGAIRPPADGRWSAEVKEAYADRVIAHLRPHIEKFDSCIVGRRVLSPADLAELNINLVGGDPYAGDCSIGQAYFWRPLPSTVRHETHIEALYHIGAATHPGPGLGGVSGFLAARAI